MSRGCKIPRGFLLRGNMTKVAICVPCMDTVPTATMLSLVGLYHFLNQVSLYEDEEGGNDVNLFVEQSSLLVSSRQNLIQRAIDWEAEWIMMVDSDMVFPANIVHRLASHAKPVVACNYVKRVVPSIPITKDFDDSVIFTNPDSTGLQKAKFTGFGACLVHSEIFKNIPKPWFDTQWMKDDDGEVKCMGEDVFFFEALRHFTNKDLYIDHDTSQEVTHLGIFEYHNRLGKASIEEFENEQNSNTN